MSLEAESCQRSEVELHEQSELSVAGLQNLLEGPWKLLGFLMLKYAFSHIPEILFLSFLTSSSTPKAH